MKLVRKKIVRNLVFLIYRRFSIYIDRQWLRAGIKIKHPHVIEIELTNDCNLECNHCHRKAMNRPIGYMEPEVFKKIIDEITTYPIAFLRIVGLGESSINPNYAEMLRYASNKGLKIEITTNGELFERFTNREILTWDIDILGISVDGTDKDSYEKIRTGGKYDILTQNIEKFYSSKTEAKRKYPLVVIRKVIMPNDKSEEIQQFIETWRNKSDMVTFNTLSKVENRLIFEYEPSFKCSEFYFTSHIRHDGSVLLCPNKFIFDQNDIIGNVKTDALEQIWKSKKLVEIRDLHKKKHFPEYCKSCFIAFNRKRVYDNSRKYAFSNNPILNKLNKYINVS